MSRSKDVHLVSKNTELTESWRCQKKVGMSVEGKKEGEAKDQISYLLYGLGLVGLESPRPSMGDSSTDLPRVGLYLSSKMDPMNSEGLLPISNNPISGKPLAFNPDTSKAPNDDESLLATFLRHQMRKGCSNQIPKQTLSSRGVEVVPCTNHGSGQGRKRKT